jgi:Domain of unknown function (DUF4326)
MSMRLYEDTKSSRRCATYRTVHCKKAEFDVYIGRPSKWGNPFEIGRDGTREEVISKYTEWLMNNPDLMEALPELYGKTLGCWCHPKACHGDVLNRFALRHYYRMEYT